MSDNKKSNTKKLNKKNDLNFINEEHKKEGNDGRSKTNNAHLIKADEYIKMMADVCYLLTVNNQPKENSYQSAINLSTLSPPQNAARDDKVKAKINLTSKPSQNEQEKDKPFFKTIVGKSENENKKLNVLSDSLDNEESYEKCIELINHKMLSERTELLEKGVSTTSYNELILLNLFLSLSRESFDLAEDYNSNSSYFRFLRTQIFNCLGMDQDSMNINLKMSNSILGYLISNAIRIKEAYKADIQQQNEDDDAHLTIEFSEQKSSGKSPKRFNELEVFEEEFEFNENKLLFNYELKALKARKDFCSKLKVENACQFELKKYSKPKVEKNVAAMKNIEKIAEFMKSVKNPFGSILSQLSEDDSMLSSSQLTSQVSRSDLQFISQPELPNNNAPPEINCSPIINLKSSKTNKIIIFEEEDKFLVEKLETSPIINIPITNLTEKQNIYSSDLNNILNEKAINPFKNNMKANTILEKPKLKITYMNKGYSMGQPREKVTRAQVPPLEKAKPPINNIIKTTSKKENLKALKGIIKVSNSKKSKKGDLNSDDSWIEP